MAAAPGAAPLVDLRATLRAVPGSPPRAGAWQLVCDYVRTAAVGSTAATGITETIKPFDPRRGADQAEPAAVLTALDTGRPVAFYGWWPTR